MRSLIAFCVAALVFPAAPVLAGDLTAPVVRPDGPVAAAPAVETPALVTGEGTTVLRDLRRLARGEIPDGALLGSDTPTKLAPGVAVTIAHSDLDGDGDLELVQVRGTITSPQLAVTDGADGRQWWTLPMATIAFGVRPVDNGDGSSDLLLFAAGQGGTEMSRLRGTTGQRRWRQGMGGYPVYYGTVASPTGGEFVLGRYSADSLLPTLRLDVEYRSLETGAVTGSAGRSATYTGEYGFPTAALAGDLDADGSGDLFFLQPVWPYDGTGAVRYAQLEALTKRGSSVAWSTAVVQDTEDYLYLVDAVDATGDGRRDPVLLAESEGYFGLLGATHTVTIVDGRGGTTAGIRPVSRTDLRHLADAYVTPGDLDGDGGEDVIFSGWGFLSGQIDVRFVAVGARGRLWLADVTYPAGPSDGLVGWWPDAGDLDGDGVVDALVLSGTRSVGVDQARALSQRTSASLWTMTGTQGAFAVPAHADGNGDGGADVLAPVVASRPTTRTTSFDVTFAGGRDLAALWSSTRVLDSGGRFSMHVSGGRLDRELGGDSVTIAYILQGPGRHHAETRDARDGTLRWGSG